MKHGDILGWYPPNASYRIKKLYSIMLYKASVNLDKESIPVLDFGKITYRRASMPSGNYSTTSLRLLFFDTLHWNEKNVNLSPEYSPPILYSFIDSKRFIIVVLY